MQKRSPDLPQKTLQIKQDDKFFGKLLSKENSIANSSLRVYYGVAAGSVPFVWESQPGTPKHTLSTTSLPPLTPPPSYYKSPTNKKPSKSTVFNTILPKLNVRRSHVSSPTSNSPSPRLSYASSYTSSSSSSSSSSPFVSSNLFRRTRLTSSRSSFSSMGDDEYPAIGSPASTLCFGGVRGCYSMGGVKNALLSVVGHGSRQGTA